MSFDAQAPKLTIAAHESYFSTETADDRTIGGLFGDYLVARGDFDSKGHVEADPKLAAKLLRQLSDTLRADYLGDVFISGEFAFYVDEYTPAGRIVCRVILDESCPA